MQQLVSNQSGGPLTLRVAVGVALAAWSVNFARGSDAPKWEPIPPEQRTATAPASSPDAPAEILYERIDLAVKEFKSVQRNFIRIKVYAERAVEDVGKLGIDYSESETLSELAARVVHPDGQVTLLPASQFQETVLGRWNHGRRMTTRLVVPRLVPGDILEWQWRIDEDGRFKGSRFLYLQQTIPVRKIEFLIHNTQSTPMNLASFGAAETKIEGLGTTHGRMVITNLPPFVEETDMPPAFNMRASALLIYGRLPASDWDLWSVAAAFLRLYESVRCVVTPELRQEAVQATAGIKYRDDQLRALYVLCQDRVTNTTYDSSPESRTERFVYHEPRTAAETWKIKRGSPLEINCLFVALANAAGFESRLAFSADRDEVMNVQFSHGWYFMKTSGALVKVNGDWLLYAPGDRAVPFGMRRWQREETETILLDDDNFIRWVKSDTGVKGRAKRTRTGALKIDESGGLTADIAEKLEGQFAISWREDHWEDVPAQLEEAVRKEVLQQLPEAEITNVKVDQLRETEAPLVLRYTIRLPNYAAVSGDHLVVMPDVFEMHSHPRYVERTRVNVIRLRHAWQEEDAFDLTLPKDFEVEAAETPPPVYESDGMIRHRVQLEVDPEGNLIHYQREEEVGREGETTFTKESYPRFRSIFERIHQAQTQEIILRRKPAAAGAEVPPSKP